MQEPDLVFVVPPLDQTFSQMITAHGVQASNWASFKDAVFGRDSIRFAKDVISYRPEVARLVIKTLASLQATIIEEDNRLLDAEVGKIHHEARWKLFEDKEASGEQLEIFERLSKMWGSHKRGNLVVYYGSDDATPDFVTLVCEYCKLYGTEILTETVINEIHGHSLTVYESTQLALAWIQNRLDQSVLGGFIETVRKNPVGIGFQSWRDSSSGYFLPSGEVANRYAPLASLEIQTKTYDALISASNVLVATFTQKKALRSTAESLQKRILDRYWMEEEQFFAMAVDVDPHTGLPRLIKTISATAFETLESSFYESLSEADFGKYVSPLLTRLFSDEFMTDSGVRCVSKTYEDRFDYWPYHGANAIWPVLNNIIALGLRKYGFDTLAEEIENRLLESINRIGYFAELMYVSGDGFVDYDLHGVRQVERTMKAVTNIPEKDQAWTVSAVDRIVTLKRTLRQSVASDQWHIALYHQVETTLQKIRVSVSYEEVIQYSAQAVGFALNTLEGGKKEQEHIAKYLIKI